MDDRGRPHLSAQCWARRHAVGRCREQSTSRSCRARRPRPAPAARRAFSTLRRKRRSTAIATAITAMARCSIAMPIPPTCRLFYQVDLGTSAYIDRVQLLRRTDANDGVFDNMELTDLQGRRRGPTRGRRLFAGTICSRRLRGWHLGDDRSGQERSGRCVWTFRETRRCSTPPTGWTSRSSK